MRGNTAGRCNSHAWYTKKSAMKLDLKALAHLKLGPSKPLWFHVRLQERILFVRHLSIALKAGISLVDSLELVRKQTRSGSFKYILQTVIEEVKSGIFLSSALTKYQNIFGELFINIIKIAEASGTLPENLLYLADELKKKADLRKKVKGAMVYPIIVLIMTIVIAAGMVFFIFPKILPIFKNSKVQLPLTTRMLIGLSDLISNYGFWVLVALIAFVVALRLSLKIGSVRRVYHRFLIALPLFGKSIVNFNMANIARTLGILLKSGVQITEALQITANSTANLVYRTHLEAAKEGVQKGEFLSLYFKNHPRAFPMILANMLEVGENTGNLTENLVYLAEYYESEVDDFVKNLSNTLEPLLLLFMGGIDCCGC